MAQAHVQTPWLQAATMEGAAPKGCGADRRAGEVPAADFSRVGLVLCFLSAALTLFGIGSALERIFF